jgi:hypothetical protein
MAAAAATSPTQDAREAAARHELTEATGRLDNLRRQAEAGGDPEVLGEWINQAARRKRAAEAELAALGHAERPVDADAVRELVARIGPTLGRRLAKLPNDKLHGFLSDYGVKVL